MAPACKTALERAFDDLRTDGILALKHFKCCAGCGSDQMTVFAHCAQCKAGLSGFCYFDCQRALHGLCTGELALLFGTLDKNLTADEDARRVAVGRTIHAALLRQGLKAKWSGNPSASVAVSDLPDDELRFLAFDDPDALVSTVRLAKMGAPGMFMRHTCGCSVEPCPHGVLPCPCGCCGSSAASRFPAAPHYTSAAFDAVP